MIPAPTPAELEKYRQDIVFSETLWQKQLTFHTTWGLFSPKEIDAGSRLLLEFLQKQYSPRDEEQAKEISKCLDVGCGYGALGLTLAANYPQSAITMIDKDYVAIEYCRKNAGVNNLKNANMFLSNGLNQVDEHDFDLIVTNLPAKSGKELYTLMFCDIHSKLKSGGACYIVTINGLRQFVKRHFTDIFGNYKKLKQGSVYTVAMATKE